ncbi:MAG: hypothetical protein CR968_04200 [Flavobacteriia bacterium]|nr:MAG: hypothetical protein CR968_04200 [Flavobacteriia bacterium]
MKLSRNTKISQIIKENPEAIERIASINKNFKKLKNPVLRKFLAPRVSIADAARIGGVSVKHFLDQLSGLGFDIEKEEVHTSDGNSDNTFAIDENKLVVLDVRPTIDSGKDPFADIMSAIKKLDKDGILKLVNSFEPVPLINVLTQKGYKTFTQQISPNEFHVFFKAAEAVESTETIDDMTASFDAFTLKMIAFGSNLKEIDVRHLEMPEPMTTILSEISQLPDDHALFVHHKKTPQFLLPELKSRGYTWLEHKIDATNVELLIYKA